MKAAFAVGTRVYHRVSGENVGMVTGHLIRERGALTYVVMWSNLEEHEHAEFELSAERDFGPAEGES